MTALPRYCRAWAEINAAGRVPHFIKVIVRIVLDNLTADARQETFLGLATLMNLVSLQEGELRDQQGNLVKQSDIEAQFGRTNYCWYVDP